MDGFYTKDGAHYCADDYHRLFVSRCRVCGELADGNVVSVLGDTYHQQCFHCSKCGSVSARHDCHAASPHQFCSIIIVIMS